MEKNDKLEQIKVIKETIAVYGSNFRDKQWGSLQAPMMLAHVPS